MYGVHYFLTTLLFLITPFVVIAQISLDKETYTVQQGDTMEKIALMLGDEEYIADLYSTNPTISEVDNSLYVGQVIKIPSSITNILLAKEELAKTDSTTSGEGLLEAFRSAFANVAEQDSAATGESENQGDPVLKFEGMVLDETRSKMARDFYDLFYQQWTNPENAENYTLTIAEQPSLGRGTQITITLDYQQIYTARLQPRYEYIEAVSQQAVAHCQNIIQQQALVREQLTGF